MKSILRKGMKIKNPPKLTERDVANEEAAQLKREIAEAKAMCLM